MKYLKTYEAMQGQTFQDWLKKHPQPIHATDIDCSYQNLTDLEGVEAFTNLKGLYCYNNQLEELPSLDALINLKELYCHYNQLKELSSLDALTNLKGLDCSNNHLEELPSLDALTNLKELYCFNNQLKELNLEGLELDYLSCGGNLLPYEDLEGWEEWSKENRPWFWEAEKFNM